MTETNNPLLAKIRIPGETFQIPSQGIFYTNNEIDASSKNGELEVFPMTTIDEIVFNSADKLLSGKAIIDVFTRCIPQVNKPLELLSKDIDFLLVCLRIVTFGQYMEIKYQHTCSNAKEHTYSLDMQRIIRTSQKFDPSLIGQEYLVKLSNGQQIQLNPTKYADILKIYDITTSKKMDTMTDQETELMLVGMMSNAIQSVDGITDKSLIIEWLKPLKLGWKKQIEQAIVSVTDWGIDNEFELTCQDCKEGFKQAISLNPVEFFFRQ